jgi:Uma2 family endonuclease
MSGQSITAWPTAGLSSEELWRRRMLEVLSEPLGPPRMSYEEFLAWADEDTLAEWVDGEVAMTSPASKRHQEIGDFLLTVLRIFVEQRDLGVILSAPFQMKLERSGREPDLIFVAKEHLGRLKETHLDGPADLAVEIVSPESVGRDRGDKFYEYAQGGVPEYWLIDPQRAQAEFYHLREGQYELMQPDEEGVYRSSVLPGFWLRVAWLWQEPLPTVEDVLLEVGGEPYARQWIERLQRLGFLPARPK